MDELVERLSQGDHPIVAKPGADGDAKALKERIEIGMVHIRFTGTRGGTELGVTLDMEASDFSQVDFEAGTGQARVVGGLSLNGTRVRCIADFDVTSMEGSGHLEPVDA